MILEYDDVVEYEVVDCDGESTYFENKDDAIIFYKESANSLILNRVATEELETKDEEIR